MTTSTTSTDSAIDTARGVRDGVLLNHIDGSWQEATGAERVEDLDPATGRPLLETVMSSSADAAAALATAASTQPDWGRTSVFERSAIVQRAATLLRDRVEHIACVLCLEEGKPLAEARGEVLRAAETLDVLAGLAYRPQGELHSGHRPDEQWTLTTSVPLGVVVVLAPWNFPLLIPAWKTVSALIAGNTVVLKPAEATPLTAAQLVAALVDAGLPAGALSLLVGRGPELGPCLLRPPAAAVTLTGGDASGRSVAQAALEHHLKCQLELGGNNPALVLADADLDVVERELVAGALSSTGQKCTATRRVFIVDSVFDGVAERLSGAFARQRLGPGIEPGTDVGPLISATARDDFEASVADAATGGAGIHRFGELPDHGFFVAPTLVTEPAPDAPVVRRETFGPMVSLFRVADLDEGIARCNETSYGLSAALFSAGIGAAIRFADGVQAGIVHVNSQTTGAEPHLPFGGMKRSSNFSRELGRWGLEWYTQVKSLYVEGCDS